MHRLEECIAQWKNEMAKADSVSGLDLAELEQHLRDSIVDLQKRGLGPEEAFLIARFRLGTQDALAAEYGKVHSECVWRKRVFWMLGGYLLIMLCGTWISALSTLATAAAGYMGLSGTWMGIAAAGVTYGGWSLLLIALLVLAFSGEARISRAHSSSRSLLIAVGVAIAILAGAVLTAGGRILTMRLVSIEAFGQSAVVTAVASYVLQLLIPVACLAMMLVLSNRHAQAPPVAAAKM